jgi:hypothetical protein
MSKNSFSFKGKQGLKLSDNAKKKQSLAPQKKVKSEMDNTSHFGSIMFPNSQKNKDNEFSKAISSTFLEEKKGKH